MERRRLQEIRRKLRPTITNTSTRHRPGRGPADQSQQKDILFAYNQNQTGRTAAANDPVSLSFNHALSQITFSGKVKASNVTVDVNSITIHNADAKGSIGFTSDDSSIPLIGAVTATGADRLTADYSPGLIASATLSGETNIDHAKNLTAQDGALMLIPQIRTSDKWEPSTASISQADATYLTVSCKIMAGDVYLVGTASDYSSIYLPLDISWEPGKHYDYTIVFGAANDNGGGFDDDGNPIDQLLPVSYSVIATNDWTNAVDPTDYEDEWPQEPPTEPKTVDMSYTIRTTTDNESVKLPFVTGDCPAALSIDWGDGTRLTNVTTIGSGTRSHTYTNPGDYLFYNCNKLAVIPARLFDNCTEVKNFSDAFDGCPMLTSIPAGLFDNCTEVTSFQGAFDGSTSLTEIPEGILDRCTEVTDFGHTFEGCSNITCAVPELWDTTKWPNVLNYSKCFNGCTNAANYGDIPWQWR